MALPAFGNISTRHLHSSFLAALRPSGDECTAIFDIQNLGREGKPFECMHIQNGKLAKCVFAVISCLALEGVLLWGGLRTT